MKKLLASLLSVMMVMCFMPGMAWAADGVPQADGPLAQVNGAGVEGATLKEIIAAAPEGAEIKLLRDADISTGGRTVIEKAITIDLNGNKIKVANNTAGRFYITESGSLTIDDNAGGGKIYSETAYSGVNSYTVIEVYGTFILNAGEINTPGNFAVGSSGNSKIVINGGKIVAGYYAISGNGTNKKQNTTIEINGGSLESTIGAAIYQPQNGTTTVNGGTLKGTTGIAIKAGNLTVAGGEIIATGTELNPPQPSGNGIVINGSAIQIESNNSYAPLGKIEIKAGKVTSEKSIAITQYDAADSNFDNCGGKVIVSGGEINSANGEPTIVVSDSAKNHTNVTGGTFSNKEGLQDYLPDGTETKLEDGKYVLAPAADAVVQVGKAYFSTLEAALAAAVDGDTIKLINPINANPTNDTASGNKGYTVSKNITIDLNGNSITTTTEAALIVAKGAKLTVDDSSEPKTGAITGGTVGIKMGNTRENDQDANSALIVNNGKITGKYYGISGNGQRHGTTITVNGGEITGKKGTGIYHPQGGTLTVNGGVITGETGIEIRSGNLVVTGGEIKGTANSFENVSNSNGTTTTGAGIAIVQHTTQKPIDVQIKGGKTEGIYAVYEKNTEKNPAEAIEQVKVEITGGNFEATGERAVECEDETGFIKGGTFNKPLDKKYLASGVTQNSNGTVTRPYVPPTPTTQNPTIEADSNATVTLSDYGTKATIKVADGYELVDVTVNGISKGKVDTLTGLKTGDKVVVTTKKIVTVEDEIAAVKATKLVARSANAKAPSGKKAIKVYWFNKDGSALNLDGYEIYRSTKKNSGYGKKPIYTAKKTQYFNTSAKKGTRYYYKVRGFKEIGGEKVYTDFSLKAIRTAK